MSQTPDVLKILIEEVRKDIVGPRGGEEEVLPFSENPMAGYLSGVISPRHTPLDQEDSEKNYTASGGDGDDSPAEHVSAGMGLKPSSFGLSCVVSEGTSRVLANVKYGRYSHTKDRNEFYRSQLEEEFTIILDKESESQPFASNPNFLLRHSVRRSQGVIILNVFVVNNHVQKSPRGPMVDTCIFQPSIVLTAQNGTDKIFLDRPDARTDDRNDHDSLLFDMLFRDKYNFATGYSCAAEWNEEEAECRAVSRIWTSFIPKHTVPNIRPREMEADGLYMKNLYRVSELREYRTLLLPVAAEYEKWIEELELKADSLPDPFKDAARRQAKQCRSALMRIKRGIEIVSSDAVAGRAFSFANRAMLLHQSYGKWARQNREAGRVNGGEPAKYSGKWRLFQLAFFLLSIESIHSPESEYRKTADLLWFATGGGKTEAYMGIIAFTIAHRRLRNKDIDHLRYGTAVIMRYTLRLLTLQQFHRLAALVCACEFIRRRDVEEWGDEPFLIGLWVGSNTTPNKLDGDYGAKQAILNASTVSAPRENNPIQIVSCPWCGRRIGPRDYTISGKIRQCRIHCPNKSCEFSSRPGTEDRGIPVLVVDEDIYKRCPSLLIGTVDKFAQIAWKWETGSIFGMVDKYCQKHGFVRSSLVASSCRTHRDAESFQFTVPNPPRLEPPELIIQDELHLIAGPLGTLTGLYETAIDILCTNDRGIPPKVIASTATARRSQTQMLNLFNRKSSAIFPPQGIKFGESFFAEAAPAREDPGRTYIGVCAPAKSELTVLGRVSAAVLRKTRSLVENMHETSLSYADLDPYYTLVSYFNTIRALGGANKMYSNSVPGYIQRIFSNFENGGQGSYKNQPLERRELTSRIDSGAIPTILKELDTELDGTAKPLDLLLCTNMLSVGVDVSRLGMMIINGQPKNHSEYIQASGRIGRRSPGLIITNYNHLKPRDLSHYENFMYYHSTFHKNVESVSITPFASRARDRALFGILVALVRLMESSMAKNESAGNFGENCRYVSETLDTICRKIEERTLNVDGKERDATLKDLKRLIGEWEGFAANKKPLAYAGYGHAGKENSYYLLGSVENASYDALKTIPMSLRDAEGQARLWYMPDSSDEDEGG